MSESRRGRKAGQSRAKISPADDIWTKRRLVRAGSFDPIISGIAEAFWTLGVIQQPGHPCAGDTERIELTRQQAVKKLAYSGGRAAERLDSGFFERLARALEYYKEKRARVAQGKDGTPQLFVESEPNLDEMLLRHARECEGGLEILASNGRTTTRATFADIYRFIQSIAFETVDGGTFCPWGEIDRKTLREALRALGIKYAIGKAGRKN